MACSKIPSSMLFTARNLHLVRGFLYFPLLSNDFPRSSMMFNGISQRPAMLTPDTVSKMNHTAALTSVELRYILKILEIRWHSLILWIYIFIVTFIIIIIIIIDMKTKLLLYIHTLLYIHIYIRIYIDI